MPPAVPSRLIQADKVSPSTNFITNEALSFSMSLPPDVLAGAEPAENGAVYSTAYVFFALCAGEVKPAAPDSGESFPLVCYDKETGAQLNPDSYIVGYTQIFAFSDGRTNTNPVIMGMKFDGEDVAEDEMAAPIIAACKANASDPGAQGCGAPAAADCQDYEVLALVDDLAELDPESTASTGALTKEAIWVDYFADGGSFSGAKQLVFDPRKGYSPDHGTRWTPPIPSTPRPGWS